MAIERHVKFRNRLALMVAPILATLFVAQSVSGQDVDGARERIRQAQSVRMDVIRKAVDATVMVFSPDGNGGGSGVLVSPDGYALTNFHVVKPCGNFMKCGLADGKYYDAVIVGLDPTGDVALIKLVGRTDFPTAPLADSDRVEIGHSCFAVGNPFLLATDLKPTVTYGMVSGVQRYQYPAGTLLEYTDCIQTDASINPGNSGGPLFNEQGEVIGVNGRISIEKRGRVNVGVGYAISSNQLKKFMGCLMSGRIVDHATLGATVATSEEGRVAVTDILDNSDAYRRGLRFDDEIVRFGDREIDTTNGFKNILGIYPKGWKVPLVTRRGAEDTSMIVRLAGIHGEEELVELVSGPEDAPRPPQLPQLPIDLGQTKLFSDEVTKLFEERRGYANYYFNKEHQARVSSLIEQFVGGKWTEKNVRIKGTDQNNGPFELAIGKETAAIKSDLATDIVDFEKDLSTQMFPQETRGMVVAVYHFSQILAQRGKELGDVYYYGTAPWNGEGDLLDVIVGTVGDVESRFYIDPKTGMVVGQEYFADLSGDACEIRYGNYKPANGINLPHEIRISVGGSEVLVLNVQAYEVTEEKESK